MLNLDKLREKQKSIAKQLLEAVQSGNEESVTQSLDSYNELIAEMNNGSVAELVKQMDGNVLTARGVRQITSEERQYAEAIINASKSPNPQQALVDVPKAMPQTIIDTVMEDIRSSHPLLDAIDFQSANYNIKVIYNEDGTTPAVWGTVTAAIATELSKTIKTLDSNQNKLSAFLPVPKAFLDFQPEWLVSMIMAILSESYAAGLEKAIIKGTGKNEPIGMCKNLKGSVLEQVYSDKEKKTLTEITPASYNAIVAEVAKKANGEPRAVSEVIFICNPVDYLTKVLPATTVLTTSGSYNTGVFPFPTKVIQSEQLAQGEAILGIASRYLAVVGTSKDGAISYDDSVQFLEDNRVYVVKGYGDGRPKDNNAFVYLDISGLTPRSLQLQLVDGSAAAAYQLDGSTDSSEE